MYTLGKINKDNITQALLIDAELLDYNIDKEKTADSLNEFFNMLSIIEQNEGINKGICKDLNHVFDYDFYRQINDNVLCINLRSAGISNGKLLDIYLDINIKPIDKFKTAVFKTKWVLRSNISIAYQSTGPLLKVKKLDKSTLSLIEEINYNQRRISARLSSFNFNTVEKVKGVTFLSNNPPPKNKKQYREEINKLLTFNPIAHSDESIFITPINKATYKKLLKRENWPEYKQSFNNLDLRNSNVTGASGRNSVLKRIEAVFEKDNTRTAFISGNDRSYYYEDGRIDISPEDPVYNYIDAGRVLLIDNYSEVVGVFQDINGKNIPYNNEDVLSYLYNKGKREDDLYIISDDEINKAIKSLDVKKQKEENKKKAEKKVKNKLQSKILKLSNPASSAEVDSFELNEVTYYPDKFVYLGQELGSTRKVMTRFYNKISSQINPDFSFDEAFSYFITSYKEHAFKNKDNKPFDAVTIGDVKAELVFKFTKSGADSYYINDKKINKDDVSKVLESGLCYQKQKDYQQYINKVSKLSLRLHTYLHKGIECSLKYPDEGFQFKMTFPVKRKGNKNYLNLDGNLYSIHNINRLISGLEKNDNKSIDFVKTLTDDNIVSGIPIEDILKLVKAAREEYETAFAKSKKLLEETEKEFDIEAKRHTFANNSGNRYGYLIEGKLGSYVIEFDPEKDIKNQRCQIYRYPSGRHVCIIDKSTDQTGFDKLINRIYALHNDSLLISKIHTLR